MQSQLLEAGNIGGGNPRQPRIAYSGNFPVEYVALIAIVGVRGRAVR
jgi:hypothetical protein